MWQEKPAVGGQQVWPLKKTEPEKIQPVKINLKKIKLLPSEADR